MKLFHFTEPLTETHGRKWLVPEHALLWIREIIERPEFVQICVKGDPAGNESTTFVVNESYAAVLRRIL